MKLDSKYFDSIRVKPDAMQQAAPEAPCCQWKGCGAAGLHRAPKGRGHEGEYYLFCIDHVRHYNATYNYFDGMSAAEVEDFQKDAMTGHRPTWKTGAHGGSLGARHGFGRAQEDVRTKLNGSHAFFAWQSRNGDDEIRQARRRLKPLEVKAFETLHLDPATTRVAIKARFKELVKLHHPDSNGGDRRSEDKLREIIQAYNYLRQAGLA